MKAILYYTDFSCPVAVRRAAEATLDRSGLPIIMVALDQSPPIMPEYGPNWTVLWWMDQRGYLSMFRQILAGLELLDQAGVVDTVFLAEHDVLYPDCHWQFEPPHDGVYWYNQNIVTLRVADGYAVQYTRRSTLALCAAREQLVEHYRKRVATLSGLSGRDLRRMVYRMGFEPGGCSRKEKVDQIKSQYWLSEIPIVDLKHNANLTLPQWTPADFRNKKWCQDWREITDIPGWGTPHDVLTQRGISI